MKITLTSFKAGAQRVRPKIETVDICSTCVSLDATSFSIYVGDRYLRISIDNDAILAAAECIKVNFVTRNFKSE